MRTEVEVWDAIQEHGSLLATPRAGREPGACSPSELTKEPTLPTSRAQPSELVENTSLLL